MGCSCCAPGTSDKEEGTLLFEVAANGASASGVIETDSNGKLGKLEPTVLDVKVNEEQRRSKPSDVVATKTASGSSTVVSVTERSESAAPLASAAVKPMLKGTLEEKTQEETVPAPVERKASSPAEPTSPAIKQSESGAPSSPQPSSPSTPAKVSPGGYTSPSGDATATTSEPGSGVDGAYLLYAPANDGQLLSLWKKEDDPGALAFCRAAPDVRVPPFKYRSRTEILRGLHRTRKGICEGLLQFFRAVRAFRCEAEYRGLHSLERPMPEVLILVHHPNNTVTSIAPRQTFSLTSIDAIAIVITGTPAEKDLQSLAKSVSPVPLEIFQSRCKANADNCEYLVLS